MARKSPDEKLTLSNLCRGELEANFQRELQRLKDYCEENNQDLGAIGGRLVFTIEIKGRRDEPDGKRQGDILDYTFTVKHPKVTFPERLGTSQRVRKDGEMLVVDAAEMDEHKTRRLPFQAMNGGNNTEQE